jgi:hypothetical protein
LSLLGFAGAHFGARIAASSPVCDSKVLQAPARHGGLQRWRLLNLGRFIMKKIIPAPTLAAVAVLTVHIQPVAACGISNGVADGHSVLMFAATLVFALAAGTVTLITGQPQSATADPNGGGVGGQSSLIVYPTPARGC